MSAADVTDDRVTVEIWFPYFKQGDDFSSCDGDLERFIAFHQYVIQHTRAILNLIPENMRQYVKGDGGTHSCWLSGPKNIMDNLVNNNLARRMDEDSED